MGDFDSSKLGTLEHWENAYKRELAVFKETGDPGEVWFGESAERRICLWVSQNLDPDKSTILDLGCGNGSLLLRLAEKNFKLCVGVDYSPHAIRLARAARDAVGTEVDFEVADICATDGIAVRSLDGAHVKQIDDGTFNCILDKGTFDAISLAPDGTVLKAAYAANLARIASPQASFIITSCNWTKEELLGFFTGWILHADIPAPSFSFGGQTGRTVTTLVLKNHPESQ